jgi:hypothetical protein
MPHGLNVPRETRCESAKHRSPGANVLQQISGVDGLSSIEFRDCGQQLIALLVSEIEGLIGIACQDRDDRSLVEGRAFDDYLAFNDLAGCHSHGNVSLLNGSSHA